MANKNIAFEEDDSGVEIDDLPEGVMTTASRGKGFTDRHRDCFLFRFGKSDEFTDRMIPDFELIHMFQRRVGDKFFNELKSVSLTPVAKKGLGKYFTFDFIAPCFEPVKYGDNQR